jgi:hypothetical protein
VNIDEWGHHHDTEEHQAAILRLANILVDNTVRFPLRREADGPFTTLVQVSLPVLASPEDTRHE